jgi:hypothetical protein
MLPGFSGHLLSGAFVERHVAAIAASSDAERVRRELVSWRAGCTAIGPASTPRSILQSAAAPFCAALGFDPPAAVEPADATLAATIRADGRAVALLVVPWGEALDPLWRRGHAGGAAASSWCLLFDGPPADRGCEPPLRAASRRVRPDLAIDHAPPHSPRSGSLRGARAPLPRRARDAVAARWSRRRIATLRVCRRRDGVLAASARSSALIVRGKVGDLLGIPRSTTPSNKP